MSKAKDERDKALKKVLRNAGKIWVGEALDGIWYLPKGYYTGEKVRLTLLKMGTRKPHHHNAWGSLIRTAIKRGYLKETYALAHMEEPKSHARRTPVYEKI